MNQSSKLRFAISSAALACLSAGLAGCSPLSAYNALAPVDTGVTLTKTGIAYGTHPRQKLDVYVPDTSPPRNAVTAPMVVIFYGGSWNSGNKEDYGFLGKALASRGFVAVVADYRLVPEVRFPAFLDDGAAAVAWAHRNAPSLGGDPNQLFLLGHSAGAYIAAMVALDKTYLNKAGSSPAIIKGVAALAGPYDFLPLDVDVAREAFGRAKNLAVTQPVNFATSRAPAMFLATGSADTTVQPRNTYALAERLKQAGTTVVVRSYPQVTHVGLLLAMSVPFRHQAPVLDDVSDFIRATR